MMVRMVFRVVIVVSGALAFPEELRNASHVASLFASLETFEHIKVTKREWEDDEEAVHKRSF